MAQNFDWNPPKIKELRKRLDLTQSEFARELGCRQQTVSEWELGLYAPANAYGKLLSHLALRVALTPTPNSNFSSAQNFEPEDYVDKGFDPAID